MKKIFFFLIAVGLVLLLLNFSFFKRKKNGEDVVINMQIAWAEDSGRGMCIRGILDEFEKQNPGIKVNLIGGSQSDRKLLTLILSGEAPEVLQVPYRDVRAIGGEGGFIALDKWFNREKSNYYDAIWDLGIEGGNLYGFPWMGHSIQLVYNKTMFDKAGLKKAPDNWEELYEYAKKLTIDKDGDGKIDQYGIGLVGKQHDDIAWLFNMFANQAGAKIVEEKNGKNYIALNSPKGKKALDFYVKLIKETSPPDTGNKNGGDVMADFRNQIVAMEFQGPWGITDIWKSGNPFEVAAAPVPAGDAGRAADIGPYMLSIPVGVKDDKLDASINLIKFLSGKEGQVLLMKGEKADDGNYYPFRVPIRKDMISTEYFRQHPEFLVFIEGFKYPSISAPVKEWTKIQEQVYKSQLNAAVIVKISVKEALNNIEKEGNKILQEQ